MGRLMNALREKYASRTENQNKELLMRLQVKKQVDMMCDSHLVEQGAKFTYEIANPELLGHAIAVIAEEPLNIKFEIYQISNTLFTAWRKTFETSIF